MLILKSSLRDDETKKLIVPSAVQLPMNCNASAAHQQRPGGGRLVVVETTLSPCFVSVAVAAAAARVVSGEMAPS